VKLWIDAHLSPSLAPWLESAFGIEASHLRSLGLRDAQDPAIFFAAREADAAMLTKDHDFVQLVERFGPPPRILWVTCGNTSNERMREVLALALPAALRLLADGEAFVELRDRPGRP
jgi:predicted nuclease of predicted toxin-antitoxin system